MGLLLCATNADSPKPEVTGEVEAMALYAGQSVGLVSRLQSAHDIVKDVADEAVRTLQECEVASEGQRLLNVSKYMFKLNDYAAFRSKQTRNTIS